MAEKHRECISRAEAAEAKANKRKQQIHDRQWRDLRNKVEAQGKFWAGRDLEIELDMKVSAEVGKDPVFKSAVADNQWYISQATMYGIAALLDARTRGAEDGEASRQGTERTAPRSEQGRVPQQRSRPVL